MFSAIVVGGTRADAVAAELGTTRGAVYKTVFDARAALRRALVAAGHLPEQRGSGLARGTETDGARGTPLRRRDGPPRAGVDVAGGRA